MIIPSMTQAVAFTCLARRSSPPHSWRFLQRKPVRPLPNAAAGVGTAAAKNSPLCDPTTGRIKIPAYLASVCVKPWKEGANNGGATYQGVTKDTVKVVVYVPPIDLQKNPPAGGQPPRTGRPGSPAPSRTRSSTPNRRSTVGTKLWGRKIEYNFVTYSGTDEAAQRADAVTVAAMKPFAVVDSAGGTVFSTEIAKRKIVMAVRLDGKPEPPTSRSSPTVSPAATPTSRRRTSPHGSASRSRARRHSSPATPTSRRRPGSSVSSTPSPRPPGAPSTSTSSRPTSPSRACPSSRSRSRGARRPTPRRALRPRRPRSRHRRSSRSSRTPASRRSS